MATCIISRAKLRVWPDLVFAQDLATKDNGCGYVCCMLVIAIGCSGNDVDDPFITVK